MGRFIFRRLIQSAFLLLGISILSYAMMRAAPGGPESYFDDPKTPPSTRELLRDQFGLNEPVPVQYGKWLINALQLNFGYSFIDRRPVIEKIADRLPATIELSLASMLLGLLGIPIGVYAALHRGRLPDYIIRVATVVGNAVPHWWLGLMILVFSANTVLIFPLGGIPPSGVDTIQDKLWPLALPAMISALGSWIVFSRYM